jgi:hypothetical protein
MNMIRNTLRVYVSYMKTALLACIIGILTSLIYSNDKVAKVIIFSILILYCIFSIFIFPFFIEFLVDFLKRFKWASSMFKWASSIRILKDWQIASLMLSLFIGLIAFHLFANSFFSFKKSDEFIAFHLAMDKSEAPVINTPKLGQKGIYYTDENIKWQETAKAFEHVANKYHGDYELQANYYGGVAYLNFDREKGLQLLEKVIDSGNSYFSYLAQFAVAKNYDTTGNIQDAIQSYQKLLANSQEHDREEIYTRLGYNYEKMGDSRKAVEAYFEAAKLARSSNYSSIKRSQAEQRLAALDPDKFKELPNR